MKKHVERTTGACSFCGRQAVRAFKIAGTLLRYACDDCFAARCMSCGNLRTDERGRLPHREKLEVHDILFCKNCSHAIDPGRPAGDARADPYPGYFEICKARPLGVALEFAECLVTPPGYCPYRQSLYGNHYCYHPKRNVIIKQSLEKRG
jgi:hypothetical protein